MYCLNPKFAFLSISESEIKNLFAKINRCAFAAEQSKSGGQADEATSSIDTETEVLIQSAIRTVLKNRTSFIVAHRLSTIRSADRILVIRNGRITESGTHRELLKLKGYYYDLYTTQFTETSTASLLK